MATRYFCDGCDTEFPMKPPTMPSIFGNGPTPDIAISTYTSDVSGGEGSRAFFCGWACLAAYAANKATSNVNWDAITGTTEETG